MGNSEIIKTDMLMNSAYKIDSAALSIDCNRSGLKSKICRMGTWWQSGALGEPNMICSKSLEENGGNFINALNGCANYLRNVSGGYCSTEDTNTSLSDVFK